MAGKPGRSDLAFESLLRRLALGQWPDGSALSPSRTLERELKVSHVTVLGVLRRAAEEGLLTVEPRRPVRVNGGATLRAKDILAALSRAATPRRLAYLIPDPSWHLERSFFSTKLESALERTCREEGIEVEAVHWPVLDQLQWSQQLAEGDFSAAFAIGGSLEYVMSLQALHQRRFPVIMFNCWIPGLPLPSVSFDEYDGARKLAATLADLGHRNVCLYSRAFDLRLQAREHRVRGWQDYLAENGLLRYCSMSVVHRLPWGGPFRDARSLIESLGNVTALAFAYAPLCTQFLAAPENADFRIPQELSLATFGPLPPAETDAWCPPVTTVDFDVQAVADAVCRMAGAMMEGERDVENVMLPVRINATDSIAPPSRPPLSEGA